MGQKRVGSVDLDTGEILEYSLVAVARRAPNGFAGGWVAMALSAWEMLATAPLQGNDYKVLAALMARLDFENYIQLQQVEIGKKLGMQKSHVNASIKRLLEQEIILQGPKIGRSRTYRLNPAYGWRGSGKEHQKALRAAEKAAKAGLTIHKGGKRAEGTDADLRAELERDGQTRLID